MLAFLNVFLSATQEGIQERKGKYEDYISTRRTVTSKYFLRKHLRMYVLCLHHQLHSLLPARHFVFSAWLCQRYLVRKLKVPAKWEPSLKCCYLKCHAVRAVCTHHTHYSMLDFTSLPFTFFFFPVPSMVDLLLPTESQSDSAFVLHSHDQNSHSGPYHFMS